MTRFASLLLKWYRAHKRRLPWRDHPDPYAVWVSEIMLQQTRVEAAMPYFSRWMRRFPTVRSLARASEHDVLKMWEGLGYYARVRSLRTAAQIVVQEHDGTLPADVKRLRGLPGIGRYTAGAIASIAFGLDEPAVDGNIRRVLARVFNVAEPVESTKCQKRLWALAEKHLPSGEAGDYNQALMDLGATVCIPVSPRCGLCPVNRLCEARRIGIQADRPVKSAKAVVPHHVHAAAVIVARGRVLLARRPSTGLLGGMWEFPNAPVRGNLAKGLVLALKDAHGLDIRCEERRGVVQHGYSHFSVEVHAFGCSLVDASAPRGLKWISVRHLDDYPMGRIDRQIARMLA